MAELAIKIKLQAFDEVSSRLSNIIKTSSRLSAKLADNQEKLKDLNKQTRNLQAFDALKQKANGTKLAKKSGSCTKSYKKALLVAQPNR